MNQLRNAFLENACSSTLLIILVDGLLKPRAILAAEWDKNGFEAREPLIR